MFGRNIVKNTKPASPMHTDETISGALDVMPLVMCPTIIDANTWARLCTLL